MSKSRVRTGLSKPREIEKDLLELQWRATGAALSVCSDKPALKLQSMALAASEAWGVDLTTIPISKRNAVADGLLLLFVATADEVFQEAFEEMRRRGLDGPDGPSKIAAMLPVGDDQRGMQAFIETLCTTASTEAAVERAAAKFAVPSSSFDGAVQAMKRTRLRTKRRIVEK